jgi:hypothetical protein
MASEKDEAEELIDEVDIEEYAKADKKVPPARRYRIRIDREQKVVEQAVVTGRFILSLVGKTPEKYLLSQRVRGQVKEIGPDEKVNLQEPGVERFMTLPRDPKEG